MKKTFSVILLFVFLMSVMTFNVFAIGETLIDDAADLFSDTEESEIYSALSEMASATDFSAAVITTEFAEGKTSQSYADDYYDNLVISEGWSQNGILFLIDMDNREVCISTMGECINAFDYYVDLIIDNGYGELANGNYSDCVLLMIDAACGYALQTSDGYCDDPYSEDTSYIFEEEFYPGIEYSGSSSRISFSNVLFCVIIALVIAGISVLVVKNSYKNTGKGDEFDSEDLVLTLTGSNDTVISRNVITTKIPRNNNNHRHGGGSSHGGGVHRSSGGFSHGGGSRKF